VINVKSVGFSGRVFALKAQELQTGPRRVKDRQDQKKKDRKN